MIIDKETDKVYFSYQSTYDFKSELTEIKSILKKYNVDWGFMAGTRDYFCRDYAPVQIDETRFVQFRFYPDYLARADREKYITDMKKVYEKNGFLNNNSVTFSKIKLDGGNIVKWKDKAIVTNKIFTENKDIRETEIIDELERLLEIKIVVVPAYSGEETGHADGLVRFIDGATVLTYNLDIENNENGLKWKENFLKTFEENNIEVKMLPPVSEKEDANNWAYLNFLQVKDLIILPVFNRDSDKTMLSFFKETFKANIETVYSQNILNQGGVLNCFTWNIEK